MLLGADGRSVPLSKTLVEGGRDLGVSGAGKGSALAFPLSFGGSSRTGAGAGVEGAVIAGLSETGRGGRGAAFTSSRFLPLGLLRTLSVGDVGTFDRAELLEDRLLLGEATAETGGVLAGLRSGASVGLARRVSEG